MNHITTQAMQVIRDAAGLRDAAIDDMCNALLRLVDDLDTLNPEGMRSWIESNIPNPIDPTKKLVLDPYQVAPMEAMLADGVDWVSIIGPEQFGKSMIWQAACAYLMTFVPGPKLIMYEEARKAAMINERRMEPLVRSIAQLVRKLDAACGKKRRNSYAFGDNDFCDFTGAGVDITSQSYEYYFLDELDTFPLVFAKKLAQVANAEKRRRIYRSRGIGCGVSCASVKGGESDSAQWQLFMETDMSFWHLGCMNCNEIAIPSHNFKPRRDPMTGEFHGGMHFGETYRETKVLVPEEIRVECPLCGRLHAEAASLEMNVNGDYSATQPEITKKRGFLFGGLSNTRGLRWQEIAESIIRAGRTNEYEVIRTHMNSVCGVAVPEKTTVDSDRLALFESHCHALPEQEQIRAVVLGADTQESPWGWFYVVRGIDEHWNTYLLAADFAKTKADMQAAIEKRYAGRSVAFAIIDQGGTNAADVKALAQALPQVWQYKGSSHPQQLFQLSKSKDQVKLLLCDAARLQVMLLRAIYDQQDKSNNYMYLPPVSLVPAHEKETFDYRAHMMAVRDLKGGDKSHLRQNWNCKNNERRDYFDAEKMLQVLLHMPLFRNKLARLMATGSATVKLSDVQKKKRG